MISFSALLALLMSQLTYTNIFILMILESSVFPVPSELVLIPAGFLIASGKLSGLWVFAVSLAGGIVGSLVSYAVARYVGRSAFNALVRKYGAFLLIREEHLLKTEEYFKKHGKITIFTGRLLPVVRHLISLPAGFSHMPLGEFTLFTAAGAGVWAIILMAIGYLVGKNEALIATYMNTLTAVLIALVALIIAAYLYWKKKYKITD